MLETACRKVLSEASAVARCAAAGAIPTTALSARPAIADETRCVTLISPNPFGPWPTRVIHACEGLDERPLPEVSG
jgi:hypothetical protein